MSVYALADTHLSLKVNKAMDVFGNRWNNYIEKLENGWRSRVGAGDTVVIPGDISWAMTMEEALEDLIFLDSLPGIKIIGRGNHDYWWNTVSKLNDFFKKNGIDTIKLLYNSAYSAGGITVCGSRGWYYDEKSSPQETDYKKITAREAVRLELSLAASKALGKPESEKVVFLHFPPVFGGYVCRQLVDVMHKYGVKRCYYGHIHTVYDIPRTVSFEEIEFSIISADYLNFLPEYVSG